MLTETQQEEKLTPSMMQKVFMLNLRNTCTSNYILGATEDFRRSVISLLAAMQNYFDTQETFKEKLRTANTTKNMDKIFDIWIDLQDMLSRDPDIYPIRLVEGVITDDDIQQAVAVSKG